MSWLDDIMGNNNSPQLGDKDIAIDMLSMSKNDILSLAKAVTETINPDVRQLLSSQITAYINDHFRLSDLAISKGWYNANNDPQQQIQQDVKDSQSAMQKS